MIERIEIKLTQDRDLKYHMFFVLPETVRGETMYFLIQELLYPLSKVSKIEIENEDDDER